MRASARSTALANTPSRSQSCRAERVPHAAASARGLRRRGRTRCRRLVGALLGEELGRAMAQQVVQLALRGRRRASVRAVPHAELCGTVTGVRPGWERMAPCAQREPLLVTCARQAPAPVVGGEKVQAGVAGPGAGAAPAAG
jgi:hypothetical protein